MPHFNLALCFSDFQAAINRPWRFLGAARGTGGKPEARFFFRRKVCHPLCEGNHPGYD